LNEEGRTEPGGEARHLLTWLPSCRFWLNSREVRCALPAASSEASYCCNGGPRRSGSVPFVSATHGSNAASPGLGGTPPCGLSRAWAGTRPVASPGLRGHPALQHLQGLGGTPLLQHLQGLGGHSPCEHSRAWGYTALQHLQGLGRHPSCSISQGLGRHPSLQHLHETMNRAPVASGQHIGCCLMPAPHRARSISNVQE